MRLSTAPLVLKTRHPFRISREVHDHYEHVVVAIEHEGLTGLGEAAPRQHFGEDPPRVLEDLSRAAEHLGHDPFALEAVLKGIEESIAPTRAALAAIDMALHDLIGKHLGMPLYRLFGLDPAQACLTSFTIGLDTVDVIREKVRQASAFPILKIKLGTAYDGEILEAVREESDATLRVDANGAWSPEEAVEKARLCQAFDVEVVEQPVAAGDLDGLRFVRERVSVPIIADESVLTAYDIPRHAGKVDGINIKVSKCGGLRETLRMIHTARAHGLLVMLGCRVESSLSITAAAHLAPLADYADLDGHLLLAEDPFEGVRVEGGRLLLPDSPGLGVQRREGRTAERHTTSEGELSP